METKPRKDPFTKEEYLIDLKEALQKTETEQNALDGAGSFYSFTDEDVIELTKDDSTEEGYAQIRYLTSGRVIVYNPRKDVLSVIRRY